MALRVQVTYLYQEWDEDGACAARPSDTCSLRGLVNRSDLD